MIVVAAERRLPRQTRGSEGLRVTTKEAYADDRSVPHCHRIAARRSHLHATSGPVRSELSENTDLLASLDKPMLLVGERKGGQDPFPILQHGFATVKHRLVDQHGVIPLNVRVETVGGNPKSPRSNASKQSRTTSTLSRGIAVLPSLPGGESLPGKPKQGGSGRRIRIPPHALSVEGCVQALAVARRIDIAPTGGIWESAVMVVATSVVHVIFLIVIVGFLLGLAAICALKGKWVFFVLGFFSGLFWIIGASRLGKPNSYWARHRYEDLEIAERPNGASPEGRSHTGEARRSREGVGEAKARPRRRRPWEDAVDAERPVPDIVEISLMVLPPPECAAGAPGRFRMDAAACFVAGARESLVDTPWTGLRSSRIGAGVDWSGRPSFFLACCFPASGARRAFSYGVS